MITLDVADYCSACMDFDPDVQRPQKVYGLSEEIVISDTVIRCSKVIHFEQHEVPTIDYTTSVINKVACDRVIYKKGESNVSKI